MRERIQNLEQFKALQEKFMQARTHEKRKVLVCCGTGCTAGGNLAVYEELKKQMDARYHSTLHIDNSAVIRTFSGTGKFEEYPVDGTSEAWSRTVMDNIEKMKT